MVGFSKIFLKCLYLKEKIKKFTIKAIIICVSFISIVMHNFEVIYSKSILLVKINSDFFTVSAENT